MRVHSSYHGVMSISIKAHVDHGAKWIDMKITDENERESYATYHFDSKVDFDRTCEQLQVVPDVYPNNTEILAKTLAEAMNDSIPF